MTTPDAVRKAAKASVASRRRAAAERAAAADRRASQRTPGHHETCACPSCLVGSFDVDAVAREVPAYTDRSGEAS